MVFLMSKHCRIPLPEAHIAVHIFKSSAAQSRPQRYRRVERFSRVPVVPLGSPVWRSDCMLATCTSATAPASMRYKCQSGTRCSRPVQAAAAMAEEDGVAGTDILTAGHTHTHTYTHTCAYVHPHIHTHTHTHPRMRTRTHTRTRTHGTQTEKYIHNVHYPTLTIEPTNHLRNYQNAVRLN